MWYQEMEVKVNFLINIQSRCVRNNRQTQRHKQNRVRRSVNKTAKIIQNTETRSEPVIKTKQNGLAITIRGHKRMLSKPATKLSVVLNCYESERAWVSLLHLQLMSELGVAWRAWVWRPCCLYAGAAGKWSPKQAEQVQMWQIPLIKTDGT